MDDKVFESPEQKILRYKKPDASIPVNAASLLFARYSFFQFENRIDIRKYFVTKFENGKNPEINSKLMPGKRGLCLTFPEALELLKALRAMLRVARYCPEALMEPDEAMMKTALSITDLGASTSVGANSRKRCASDSGSTILLSDINQDEADGSKVPLIECSQAVE